MDTRQVVEREKLRGDETFDVILTYRSGTLTGTWLWWTLKKSYSQALYFLDVFSSVFDVSIGINVRFGTAKNP